MRNPAPDSKVIFVTTYPPTQCGIATFTQDLMSAINNSFGQNLHCVVCNLTDAPIISSAIPFSLNPKIKDAYKNTAIKINNEASIKLVHIQHEFGLFGGEYGNYLLDFLDAINKPVVFTFHSVIPNPTVELKSFVKMMVSYANRIFVMTKKSQNILTEQYEISEEIIDYTPHGTHTVNYENPAEAKQKLNLENRSILSTFGLLSPGKSIETAIKAMPEIIKHTPDVLYLIIGKTHPNTIKNNIDEYRDYLEDLVMKLDINNHVRFIDRYLETSELLEYLMATDIYLFTSKDPNQAVSGTFVYALSCACPIIATSIPHTKELLANNAGILYDIGNCEQLANATNQLLSNGDLRESMAFAAYEKTRESSWENVAIKHANTYGELIDKKNAIRYNYPPIKLDHLKKMTTNIGIIQFSKISEPDITSGYTLDDNARALIAVCSHYKLDGDPKSLNFIITYLNFILRCQNSSGTFVNYIDENNHEHIKNNYINLEDSNSRAVWALGTVISLKDYLPKEIIDLATFCFMGSLPWVKNILSPRSIGFATKGLYLYYDVTKDKRIAFVIEKLTKNLITDYDVSSTVDWHWFEDYMTYANSILPEAMLYSYLISGKQIYKKIAIESFDFLLSKMFVDDHFKAISNKGWYQKGVEPNQYGEQPIDVSYAVLTLDLFHKTFNDSRYETLKEKAFSWFLGKNHLHQMLYNSITGGCHDGLEKENVNLNQGAESTICYLMARLAMEPAQVPKSKPIQERTGKIANGFRILK
ncbi:MAG: glycosyl transferase family 1 [Flavobacteria bacterium RIFCSPLOWO2_12_FULL_35_11]|nr:MAG: glycosyl transferase family 1 [Flavobacteria bacterium RIFCSPLOWO2_12_FULL_35_11]